MTEDEARAWCADRFGSHAVDRVGQFLAMVTVENDHQNLIAPSTVASIWNRHALDSAQLIGFTDGVEGPWGDIGSGGGFPGMIVALLRDEAITLIEPRRKRAEFLARAASKLGLRHVAVEQRQVEAISQTFAVISARAVASVEKLLIAARHCATPTTRWLLPRGRIEQSTMDWLKERGEMFHVEHSLSDPASAILVIDGHP